MVRKRLQSVQWCRNRSYSSRRFISSIAESSTVRERLQEGAFAIGPVAALLVLKLSFAAWSIVLQFAPCEVPNAGAPMQLFLTIFVFALIAAGAKRFGGALIGYIVGNGKAVVGGIAIFALALWFAGGIDSLLPFFYEQLTGETFGSSGFQCAVGGGGGGGGA